MPNPEHLSLLKTSSQRWNTWRKENPNIRPDLRGLDFRQIRTSCINIVFGATHDHTFDDYDFRDTNLSKSFIKANAISRMKLSGADLSQCDLSSHDLSGMDLSKTNLYRSNLSKTILNGADLSNANLTETDLRFAVLTDSDLSGARLSSSLVYGISTWNTNLFNATQENLIITPEGSAPIAVDNLKLAQFIYLILNNRDIRDVIETVTSKAVLLLGRFEARRKTVLDQLRTSLRAQGLAPILFDFEKPSSRDLTETIVILAGLSRFVIADISDPASVPQELTVISQQLPSATIQPVIEKGQTPYSLFEDLSRRAPATFMPIIEYPPDLAFNESLAFDLIETIIRKVSG